MNFTKKNILITGASTGIGKALVEELVNTDCKLFIVARRLNLLDEIKTNLSGSKAEIFTFRADLSTKVGIVKVYSEIKNIGTIDIAILNAGVGHRVEIEEFNSSLAEEIFNVNSLSLVYWTEALLPDFLNQKDKMIVGVSSLADNRGFSGSGFYCASKAAASIYLEGLRIELKKYGVKVLTVKPGFVKTPMTDKNNFDMPLIMSPGKAAKIILKGIKKEKRIIQFPFPIVLGSKLVGLLPAWLYDFLSSKSKV